MGQMLEMNITHIAAGFAACLPVGAEG